MAQFRSKPFGVTKNGDKVDEYIISNPGGLEVSVLNYGCVIKNLFVPTKTGLVDVVVGHDTLADYEADFNSSGSTCCGAFVGRYANRIENAEFSLSGKTYKLEANNGKNHLHGTFPRKIYDVKMFGDTLLMETESPAGEDGFPGNLKVSVRYILTPADFARLPTISLNLIIRVSRALPMSPISSCLLSTVLSTSTVRSPPATFVTDTLFEADE